MKAFLQFLIVLIFTISSAFNVFAVGPCDNTGLLQRCIGNNIKFEKKTGVAKQYLEVDNSQFLSQFTNQLTVDLWFKLQRESGKRQYLTGVWGPSEDDYDVWAVYVSEDDSLTFEINHPTSKLKNLDNTVVKCALPKNLNKWYHLAVVFDGNTNMAQIYLDGFLQAENKNVEFPISTLKQLAPSQKLNLLIGSTNTISNNPNYHSFYGEIDEFKMWNKALSFTEIYCNRYLSLNGNEANLKLLHRFNEEPNIFSFCDATNNGFKSSSRNGATTVISTRTDLNPYVYSINTTFPDTVECGELKKYTITVTDTTMCGSKGRIGFNEGIEYFTFSNVEKDLPPNTPVEFTVTLKDNFKGTITPRFGVYRNNRCRYWLALYWERPIVRLTELSVNLDTLEMGFLTANCVNYPYVDKTFKLYNNTSKLGNSKIITVSSFTNAIPNSFQIISPIPPFNINAGDSIAVTVRFHTSSQNAILNDAIRIASNDNCGGERVINLKGAIEEAISILDQRTQKPLSSIDFGTVCLGYPSKSTVYNWMNVSSFKLFLDSVRVNPNFDISNFNFPVLLESKKGNLERTIRFLPKSEGVFNDTIFYIFHSEGGCVIKYPIAVKGICIDPKLKFTLKDVDFGNVIVGQEKIVNVEVENLGSVDVNVLFTIGKADAFVLTGAKSISIPKASKRLIPVTFRPTKEMTYLDKLYLYEPLCYKSLEIDLKGVGILDNFSYNPEILEIKDVISCDSSEGQFTITNRSSQKLTLSNFTLDDVNNKFMILSPSNLNSFTVSLDPNQSQDFTIRYVPNDNSIDRADKAFLRYQTQDASKWSAKIIAYSETPEIYVPEYTPFGVTEIGGKIQQSINLENFSNFRIFIDSISLPNGFKLISPSSNIINNYIEPEKHITLLIEFEPLSPGEYKGDLQVFSNNPCQLLSYKGQLAGTGKVVPMEIINTLTTFGFVRPCDCEERVLPLVNNSNFAADIKDIYIDNGGNAAARSWYFNWKSDIGGTNIPYKIPARTIDSLRVLFCPQGVAERDSIAYSGVIHINSEGAGWQANFERDISGKQTLYMEPDTSYREFPSTQVNIDASPIYSKITIPPIEFNPNRADLKIDSIIFEPNQRVFTAKNKLGSGFPIFVKGDDTLQIEIGFKPRAPKVYKARMKIYFSEPCVVKDTTLEVVGEGFAAPFSLALSMSNPSQAIKEYKVISCDTLEIPIYTNRKIPAEFIDLKYNFIYDTTKFEYIGYDSYYINNACNPHNPYIVSKDFSANEKEMNLFNLCNVDVNEPFMIAKFKPKQNQRDTIWFKIDSISFDTPEVINYRLIAYNDSVKVIIQRAMINFESDVQFKKTKMLDCDTLWVYLKNLSDVPIAMSSFYNLANNMEIIDLQPPFNGFIQTDDSVKIKIRYCPQINGKLDIQSLANVFEPCYMLDSVNIKGEGYPASMQVNSDISNDFVTIDTLSSSLNDEITVPIFFEKNLSATYEGKEYWLNDLSFDLTFNYNPKALKYLAHTDYLNANFKLNSDAGKIIIAYSEIDSMRAGKMAEFKFKLTVPDSIYTNMFVNTENFVSNDLMFLDIQSIQNASILSSIVVCAIQTLKYSNSGAYYLGQNYPNPVTNLTQIDFVIAEDETPVYLNIYDNYGNLVQELINGLEYKAGTYRIEFETSNLINGIYHYEIKSGIFQSSKQMLIFK